MQVPIDSVTIQFHSGEVKTYHNVSGHRVETVIPQDKGKDIPLRYITLMMVESKG